MDRACLVDVEVKGLDAGSSFLGHFDVPPGTIPDPADEEAGLGGRAKLAQRAVLRTGREVVGGRPKESAWPCTVT